MCAQPLSHVQLFCNPMDCSPTGSSVHGILQARILECGCHFLLQGLFLTQGIFPTQGLNLHLLQQQVGYFPLGHLVIHVIHVFL